MHAILTCFYEVIYQETEPYDIANTVRREDRMSNILDISDSRCV